MKLATNIAITKLADDVGALGWAVIRERKHLVVEFVFADRPSIVQTLSATASDQRAMKNALARLRKACRRWWRLARLML